MAEAASYDALTQLAHEKEQEWRVLERERNNQLATQLQGTSNELEHAKVVVTTDLSAED